MYNLEKKTVNENVIQYVPFSNLIRENVDSLEELKKSYVLCIYFIVVTVGNISDFLIKFFNNG